MALPAITDSTGLKERLRRVYGIRGTYAAAGAELGVNRQQMRQFVTQTGGYTQAKRDLLEPALDAFERRCAAQIARYDRQQGVGVAPELKTLQNTPIPNIAQDVLRYMLDAVEARRIGGGADA